MADDPYTFVVASTIDIAASPEVVFDRLCDITRVGELSPECTGGEWITEGAARVGARFVGHNRSRGRAWTTECEVIVFDRPAVVAWHVLTNTTPHTSVWTFRIEALPIDGQARVTETFEMLATPRPFRTALDAASPERRSELLRLRRNELEAGIRETLRALKRQLEAHA